jgi:hypothetical protein
MSGQIQSSLLGMNLFNHDFPPAKQLGTISDNNRAAFIDV